MTGFTKLFSSIVTSTVWQEDSDTCKLWVTLLALADAGGHVDATIPGLANIANVSVDKTREVIAKFLSPDPDSRSKAHEGRRIKEVEGGWLILNYLAYRDRGRTEARREYLRDKKREERARKANRKTNSDIDRAGTVPTSEINEDDTPY